MAARPEPARAVARIIASSERPLRQHSPPGTVDLSSGDPDFPTPPHIRHALCDAVAAGYSNYPPTHGDPDLLMAIARAITRAHGGDWDASNLLITTGATGAIFAAMAAHLDPGDVVLIPQPSYSLYADVARFIGAQAVHVEMTSAFRLDLDALRAAAAAAGGRAKMLVLTTPSNPTGVVYERSELEAAARLAEACDLLVLADEVYDNLVLDGGGFVSTLAIPALRERLLYCQSWSKTYAMTGWRIGYLASSAGLISPAAHVARITNGGVAWAVQRAALAALIGPSAPTVQMCKEYQARRALVAAALNGAEGLSWTPPHAGFYAFLRYDAPIPARQMQAILREQGVLVRSGTEYGPGGEGHVRLSFATNREALKEGVARTRVVLEAGAAGAAAGGRDGRAWPEGIA